MPNFFCISCKNTSILLTRARKKLHMPIFEWIFLIILKKRNFFRHLEAKNIYMPILLGLKAVSYNFKDLAEELRKSL